MKFILELIIFSLMCSITTYGQNSFSCPLKNGFIKDSSHVSFLKQGQADPNKSIIIYSDSPVVYSISKGKVKNIFTISNLFGVIIKTDNYFITICELDSVFVRNGENIDKNQIIGKANQKEVIVLISDEKGCLLGAEKFINCTYVVNPHTGGKCGSEAVREE